MNCRTMSESSASAVFAAMVWMAGLWFLLSLLLGWVPLVGPFIGPIAGGYLGGRRAGSAGRALLAAILPTAVLSLAVVGVGLYGSAITGMPWLLAIFSGVSALMGLMLVFANLAFFAAALVGGVSRQAEAA
jgi:hypothetical protein